MRRRLAFLTVCAFFIGLISIRISVSYAQDRGLRHDSFQSIDQLLKDHVDTKKIAGATAVVVSSGKEVYRQAIGYRDVETNTPMTYDTLFRIASMTKPITSVGVMILVDEGQIKLDDPVSKYIPEFAKLKVINPEQIKEASDYETKATSAVRAITIHDLLTHTSGITYGFFTSDQIPTPFQINQVCDGLCEADHLLEENAKRIAACPLIQQPGTGWKYGLNTDVLGRVIEVAAKTTLDKFLQERIFDPLEMNDTHFEVPESKLQRMASLYGSDDENGIVKTTEGIKTLGSMRYSSVSQWPGKNKNLSGGAGLVSTAADYVKFLNMMRNRGELRGKRILSQQAVDSMTTNQIGEFEIGFKIHGDKFGYGFGVHDQSQETFGSARGTYSWAGAFYTYFWVDPQKDIVAVLMTQLFPTKNVSLWEKFHREVNIACEAAAQTRQ